MNLKKWMLSIISLVIACVLLVLPMGMEMNLLNQEASVQNNIHPLLIEKMKENPSNNIHVIVPTSSMDETVVKAEQLGAYVTGKWEFIGAFAATIKAEKVPLLANIPTVKGVMLNQNVTESKSTKDNEEYKGAVDQTNLHNAYNYSIKVDKVWEKGYDGAGVTVAVVDSGISSSNGSDFGDRVLTNEKFNSSTTNQSDKFGHGTHVAGIIGGDGKNSSGKYIGVAPGVNLLNIKFSADDGSASEEDLVTALQWIYDNKEQYNIRVVNLSSNVGTKQSYKESAVAAAVEQLWFSGIVVVVSATNNGGNECATCYAPANDPYVITVGAVDDNGTKTLSDDYMKSWSSYGETLDGHTKPDVVAPGAQIISYMPTGDLKKENKKNVVATDYFKMGGTSMSAPMVSGVVALMLQYNPNLTPDEVKWIIQNTTRMYEQQISGTPGIVAADNAVFYSGVPGKANQNNQPSPFLDASTQTISYSNMAWANMAWANMAWANSIDK